MWPFLTITLALFLAEPAPARTPPPVAPLAGEGWHEVTFEGALDGRALEGSGLVYLPKGHDARLQGGRPYPLVLALHGWDHSPALFREQADLAALADRHGLVLVLPDTGRSIFESSFFRETRGRWKLAPGARWVGEVVLAWARRHLFVASEPRQTAIFGYSTGGRGALLVAARYPDFAFAGSVSGTYDLMALAPKTGEYRIHATVLGKRKRFSARWRAQDVLNPDHLARLAGLDLYLAHGEADKVVPVAQLASLQRKLGAAPRATFVTTPGAGHTWAYWNAQWPPLFEALARTLELQAPSPEPASP